MGQICTLGYGKVNLPNIYMTFSSMKVSAPWKRDSAVVTGRRHGSGNPTPVGRTSHEGVLISAQVEHENGVILVFQSSWKRSGVPIKDGAIFFRLRAGAPHYQLNVRLPIGPQNTHGEEFSVFRGYADVMNAEDLKAEDIALPRQYEGNFMADEEVEECFMLTMLAAETMPRRQVQEIIGESGTRLREIAPKPVRRFRFGRS